MIHVFVGTCKEGWGFSMVGLTITLQSVLYFEGSPWLSFETGNLLFAFSSTDQY